MSKITALGAALLFATASAVALPAAAQYHNDRGNDRYTSHDYNRDSRGGDRDRGHDRDDRGRDEHRGDDRRYTQSYQYDRRYDNRYNNRYVPQRVYRPNVVYVAPRGYSVQRWHVGTRMPPPFYVSQYYVDPYAYQLRLPPRGYRWVRVDGDAYMVSIASGIIADVLYGIFR